MRTMTAPMIHPRKRKRRRGSSVGTRIEAQPRGIGGRGGTRPFSGFDDEQAAVGTPPDRVEREHLERGIARLEALLANRDFTSKAPAVVVDRERQRLRELEAELRQIGG